MKLHDANSFLEHRKKQEQLHLEKIKNSKNPLDSILTVEINATELCNRRCIFCPRYDPKVYPNRNLNMSEEVADKIVTNLANANYSGRLSFSGFGENLLNKKFDKVIQTMRSKLKDNWFECNTNGDILDVDYVTRLYDAGLDMLYINLYDGPEQADHFVELMKDSNILVSRYQLRAHWVGAIEDYGLKLNNRSGVINWIDIDEDDISNLIGTKCYYPFYKMFVDWNGDVLFCSNDWGREIIIGNIANQSLYDVWMCDEMKKIRLRLANGDRSKSPCNKCSVGGTLFGEPSFNLIQEHYESSDNGSH
jgi:radical SAM protein with 4Fe4S-binding SPASM domain